LTDPAKEKNTALQLQDQRITSQREIIDALTKTQQNDTKELKEAVKDLIDQIQLQQQDITRLSTIIEERIPKK
jgi:signal transduction histidine kinase